MTLNALDKCAEPSCSKPWISAYAAPSLIQVCGEHRAMILIQGAP